MSAVLQAQTVVSLPPDPGSHLTVRGLSKNFAGAPICTHFNLDLPRCRTRPNRNSCA